MPTVEVNGVSLYYEEKGSGEPLVLVHGIPTDYRAWGAQMGPFSERYRAVTVSRRYAVPNVRKGDLLDSTVGNNSADLIGLVEHLGLGPVHLVGHSYGGFISALLAADHPGAVRSLVLVEPAISTLLVADAESRLQMLSLLLRAPSVALAARRFQGRFLRPSLAALDRGDLEGAARLNVEGVQDSPGALGRLSEEERKMMVANARTVGELRTVFPRFTGGHAALISCRTLVVNGESSPLWLRRIGELTAGSIPGARRTLVAGSRHFPHMENPAEFNRKALEFLGEAKRR